MAMTPLQPADEHRRAPGPDPWWADAWEIDFAAEPGVGGFVRLTLVPNQGLAWWWTSLVTPGLVAVRDHEVALPRGGAGLEVRADGLWGELVCETPLEHWSIGLEAFGIAYDDPAAAWGDEWGERLPVGLDLEWEVSPASGDGIPPAGPHPGSAGVAYCQPGHVHGEILIGPDRIPFSGTGFRSRASGALDWWSTPLRPRLAWIDSRGHAGVDDPERRNHTVVAVAPVLVTAPSQKPVRLARALCRVEGESGGLGWAERC